LGKSYQAQLPAWVRMRAASLGEQGAQWIATLDERVQSLVAQWDLQLGEVLSGGSESLVAHALLRDGRAAILKIGLPGSADLAGEAKVYALAAGRGYAELLAHDPAHNAILLERLGPSLRATIGDVDTQIQALCHTLQDAWIPLETPHGLMTGAQKAQWLTTFIQERWALLGQPCAKATVDRALEFAEERVAAYSPAHAVLVHGDAHADNALLVDGAQADGPPRCKFVDPDGLFAEKACDLAAIMRDWSEDLLAGDTLRRSRERCELLATLTEVDAHAIWQWGFIERVSTGLVLLEIGLKREGAETLAVADQIRTG
jgi:streptomycin 6-kinase